MSILILLVLFGMLVWHNYDTWIGKLTHENQPLELSNDNLSVNMGVIPERLTWVIPIDYELREDYGMTSRIEPTFIDGTKRPLWCLVITLTDPMMTSEQRVLYTLDGELYEY